MASDGADPTDTNATDLDTLTRRLSTGLHELANAAGELERRVTDDGVDLDEETHLVLDQAHSNATALVATLDRLGLG